MIGFIQDIINNIEREKQREKNETIAKAVLISVAAAALTALVVSPQSDKINAGLCKAKDKVGDVANQAKYASEDALSHLLENVANVKDHLVSNAKTTIDSINIKFGRTDSADELGDGDVCDDSDSTDSTGNAQDGYFSDEPKEELK